MEMYNVSRETIKKLLLYEELIVEGQKKFNLVGSGTLENIWIRHFADSGKIFSITKEIISNSKKSSLNFIDVGSGAGFPGVVFSIMAESENLKMNTVLLDSNLKKCTFLENVKNELNLSFNVINKRSENIEEKFDIITSRAVTSVKKFLDINQNMINKSSNLILLKGKTWKQEIKESKKKWNFELNIVKNNILLDSSGGVTLIIRNLKK